MANQRLSPDAILEQTALTGSVTDIDEDPDSPDAAWLTATLNSTTILRTSFPLPSGDLITGAGLQEFRVLMRKTATNTGRTDDTWDIDLYENGSKIADLASGSNTPTGGVVRSATFNASLLGNINGSNVEVRIVCTPEAGGSPGSRGSIEFGAVEWNAEYTPPAGFTPHDPMGISGFFGM